MTAPWTGLSGGVGVLQSSMFEESSQIRPPPKQPKKDSAHLHLFPNKLHLFPNKPHNWMDIWVLPSLVPWHVSPAESVQKFFSLEWAMVCLLYQCTLPSILRVIQQGFPWGTVVLSVSNGLKCTLLGVDCREHPDPGIPLCETREGTGICPHSIVFLSYPLPCSPSHCPHQSLNLSLWFGSLTLSDTCQHDLWGFFLGGTVPLSPPEYVSQLIISQESWKAVFSPLKPPF